LDTLMFLLLELYYSISEYYFNKLSPGMYEVVVFINWSL